jgi:hypothetical protein
LFVGTVVQILEPTSEPETQPDGSVEVHFGGDRRVTLRMDERFVGDVGTEVTVTTGSGGGDCGYGFEVGKSYLVSAGNWEGRLYTGICSITAPVHEAYARIQQLRALRDGARVASLTGVLIHHEWDPFSYKTLVDVPLAHTPVRVRTPAGELSMNTDEDGGFSLYGLPAGRYSLAADLPQGLTAATRNGNEFNLELGACATRLLIAGPSGGVRGRIIDGKGKPLSGVVVQLDRAGVPQTAQASHADAAELREFHTALTAWIEEDGTYEFNRLPDGDYKLQIVKSDEAFARGAIKPLKTIAADADPVQVRGGNTVEVGDTVLDVKSKK